LTVALNFNPVFIGSHAGGRYRDLCRKRNVVYVCFSDFRVEMKIYIENDEAVVQKRYRTSFVNSKRL
jgi:hypothetical protein